eukprot:481068-Hanusia_phi.AAC.1
MPPKRPARRRNWRRRKAGEVGKIQVVKEDEDPGGGSRTQSLGGGRREEVGAGKKKKQLKMETAERLKGSVHWTINCSMTSLDATEHSPAAASSPQGCSASCRRRQARTFQQNVSALTCIRHETSYSFPTSSSSSSSFIPSSS